MAKLGYCGRIVCVLNKSHKEYALVQCGNEYIKITKCDFENSLDRWIRDTEENNIYSLWYNYDLV